MYRYKCTVKIFKRTNLIYLNYENSINNENVILKRLVQLIVISVVFYNWALCGNLELRDYTICRTEGI